jgi:uncharacterized DUF497 family protein
VRFEWDPRKAAGNKRKHDVSFEEAATSFADPKGLLLEDKLHPERAVLIGVSRRLRVLFTVFVELEERAHHQRAEGDSQRAEAL